MIGLTIGLTILILPSIWERFSRSFLLTAPVSGAKVRYEARYAMPPTAMLRRLGRFTADRSISVGMIEMAEAR